MYARHVLYTYKYTKPVLSYSTRMSLITSVQTNFKDDFEQIGVAFTNQLSSLFVSFNFIVCATSI